MTSLIRFEDINQNSSTIFSSAIGELDPNFGSGGKVITTISVVDDVAYAMAIQPDDKIKL